MGLAHALALPGCADTFTDAFGPRPLLEPYQVAWLGVQPQRATDWEREQAARLGLHVTTSQALAADPAGAAAAALDRLPAGPLAVHIDVDVLDFTDAPLAEDTGGHNAGPTLGQAEQALTLAARDPWVRALSIGELNPTRSAGDPGCVFPGSPTASRGSLPPRAADNWTLMALFVMEGITGLKVTAERTGLVGHAGASLSEVSRVQGPQRLPVAGFRVRVVDRVVRHRESVARGVELHGVVDARLGERVLQQFGLLRGEVLVLLGARHVNGGGDLVRSEVRARRIAGDGDPAAVERRRGGDLAVQPAAVTIDIRPPKQYPVVPIAVPVTSGRFSRKSV